MGCPDSAPGNSSGGPVTQRRTSIEKGYLSPVTAPGCWLSLGRRLRQGPRAGVDRVMGGGLILAVRPKRQDCIEGNPKADIHQPRERVD
jgi:hypothetical protein